MLPSTGRGRGRQEREADKVAPGVTVESLKCFRAAVDWTDVTDPRTPEAWRRLRR